MQTGKVTMAEANSFEDDGRPDGGAIRHTHFDALEPIMPHLKHQDRAEMDRLYPPIVAADDLDDKGEIDQDANDQIYRRGLDVARGEGLPSAHGPRRGVVPEHYFGRS